MKIRIVHQFFHPDLSSVSQVISQIAFYLAAQGDEVSVICSRNRYNGGSGGTLPSREEVDGVDILRCWGPSLGRRTFAARTLDFLSFCTLATARTLLSPRADVVVFLTNPPFFSLLGAALRRIRGERYVYHLMDVYPEIAVRAGVLREGSAAERLLSRISRMVLREADAVVVLGEDMRERAVRGGARPERVVVQRNWADPDRIVPVTCEENSLRRAWQLEGKFVVEYSGNFGILHSFEEILSVAEELRSEEDIRFLLIGAGARRKEVEERVTSRGLTNVLLQGYQAEARLSESLSAGDVHYVCLRPGFEGLVVPSKAYGIMAAGRPILYQGAETGEVARMIRRERIGIVVEPGDRDGLREAILALRGDQSLRNEMGERARGVLVEKYAAKDALAGYRRILAGAP